MPKPSALERFHASYQINADGCWMWTGQLARGSYGRFKVGGRTVRAARWAYGQLVGPVPEGLVLDHLCHTDDESCPGGDTCPHRRCVNPAHLEPVTQRENIRRGQVGTRVSATHMAALQRTKTHCVRGHEFTVENTAWRNDGKHRTCRMCARLRNSAYAKRVREARRSAA